MTLKVNSKRTLDIIAGQKKRNATQAYKEVHPEAGDVTAQTNAWKLLQKPEAQIYLEEHITKAKNKIVQLVNSEKEDISLRASQDIIDRTSGKATQRQEIMSKNIDIIIDLSGNQ